MHYGHHQHQQAAGCPVGRPFPPLYSDILKCVDLKFYGISA